MANEKNLEKKLDRIFFVDRPGKGETFDQVAHIILGSIFLGMSTGSGYLAYYAYNAMEKIPGTFAVVVSAITGFNACISLYRGYRKDSFGWF